jgi:hypothetical protein
MEWGWDWLFAARLLSIMAANCLHRLAALAERGFRSSCRLDQQTARARALEISRGRVFKMIRV